MNLTLEPLTPTAFAPFGEVVQSDGADPVAINQGFAERYNGLANIDVSQAGGHVNVSLFTARPRPEPIAIQLMERHPLGSQLFMPIQNLDWLVLVCGDPRDRASYRAFRATGIQGVNYSRNVWHHPLLVLGQTCRFLVVDRAGPGHNLEEFALNAEQQFALEP